MLYAATNLGVSMRWLNGQAFYGASRDRMDSGGSERAAFDELIKPDILAISDPVPPAGALSTWQLTQFYRLIDERYRQMKPTWCTLNATSDADADKMLSAPVWDRLCEDSITFECNWPTHRKKT